MARRRPSVRLRVDNLESRVVPAADFKITSLTANNANTRYDMNSYTGDDRGGIAVSTARAFLEGDSDLGAADKVDLGNPTYTGYFYDALTGDLKTQTAYTLAAGPGSPLGYPGGTVNGLIALDPVSGAQTGTYIPLSTPVSVGYYTGIFGGYGRVVLHQSNGGVYEIALPSGNVTQLSPYLADPVHQYTESWAYWGTAEHFGGEDYLDYVQDPYTIARQRVSDGQVTTIANFSYLSDTASFTVDPSLGRWYFHYEGGSNEFGGYDENLGYADATFQTGFDLLVTNTNDSGPGSLRAAIALSNTLPGTQTIGFDPAVAGTIALTSGDLDLTDSAEIDGPGAGVITVQGDASDKLFTDSTSANPTLTIGGLTLSNPAGQSFPYALVSQGTLVVDGGAAGVTFGPTLDVTGGTLTVPTTGNVTLSPAIHLGGGTLDAGPVTLGPGQTLDGSGTVDGNVAATAGGTFGLTGTVNGTLTADGGSVGLNGTLNGDLISKNGGSAGVFGTVNGNASADNATLSMSGTVTGDVTGLTAAVLYVGGSVDGDVTVSGGAVLSPDNGNVNPLSIGGNLALTSGGTSGILQVQFYDPNNYDQVYVGGDVFLGTDPNNLQLFFGYSPTPNDAFNLVTNLGPNPTHGALLGVANRSGTALNGYNTQFRYDGGDGNDVQLVINSSPTLDTNVTVGLNSILEDTPAATNAGTSVKALVGTGGLYFDAQGPVRGGIAVTGADEANGTWEYTVDGGADWGPVGSPSPTSAILLEADPTGQQRIRFKPNANYFGDAAIQFRAFDLTNGLAAGNTGQDVTGGGYNSAYSNEQTSAAVNVIPVNDPPNAKNDSATLAEDAGPQAVNVLANDDTGPDPNETLTITSVTQGLHGTVAITGGGTGLTYAPDPNFAGTDSFLYSIADGNGGTAFAAVSVTVLNDAADRLEVVTTPGVLPFTEGNPATAIDPGLRLGTADQGVMTGAVVKISSGYVAKKDVLGVQLPAGSTLKAKFDPKKGVLTITGAADPATYQAILRSVTYSNASPAPVNGIRTVSFQVSDDGGLGDPGTRQVQVIGVNSKPTITLSAAPVSAKANKAAAVLGGIKVADVDSTYLTSAVVKITNAQAGDTLTAVTKGTGITASFAGNVLTLTGPATVKTYAKVLASIKLLATSAGGRSITVQVNDGTDVSDPATRGVTVS